MGGNYDIEDFSVIFKHFINLSSANRILIISKTPKDFILKKLAKTKLDTLKVIIVESEFRNVYKYLQAGDVGLILYRKAFSNLGRSPTKLGEYWACGIPAISLKGIGDLDFIHKRYPYGLELLEDFNNYNLQQSLKNLFSKGNIENLRKTAKEYYHIDKGINFYGNIYRELTN
jgi:glycosyltransferase involved in cell wall biosynthesis